MSGNNKWAKAEQRRLMQEWLEERYPEFVTELAHDSKEDIAQVHARLEALYQLYPQYSHHQMLQIVLG